MNSIHFEVHLQADVLYEKLTVIRENEDMDEVGERL